MGTEPTTVKDVLLAKHHDITTFASKDQNRYVLQSVHYNEKEKLLEAVSGRVLIRVPVVEATEDMKDPLPPVSVGAPARDCLIPIAPFKKALDNIPNGGSPESVKWMRLGVTGQESSTKVNLTTFDLETEQNIACKPIDGQFPNCNQVMPKDEPKLTITISAHLLKIVADYAAKYHRNAADNAGIKLEFIDDISPVKFSLPVGDTTAVGVIMPMRTS